MSSKFIIKNYDTNSDNVDENKKVEYPLPKLPFYFIILGKRGSGKTVLLNRVIEFYKEVFEPENIILMTDTLYTDPIWQNCENVLFKNAYDHFDEDAVQSLIDESKENRVQKLLILDDLAGTVGKTTDTLNDLVTKLALRGRHYKISVIFTTQKYNLINPKIRSNASHWAIFNLKNKKEEKLMIDELSGYNNDLETAYETITREPHNFIYINKDSEIFSNFTEKYF